MLKLGDTLVLSPRPRSALLARLDKVGVGTRERNFFESTSTRSR